MSSFLKAVWNVGVLTYPVWWAWGGVPASIRMLMDHTNSEIPHSGLARHVPAIDLLFGGPTDLFLTSVNMLGMALAFTSFCWGIVKRSCRIGMLVIAVATPVYVVGHGLQVYTAYGQWSFGIDAFQTWILYCIAAWPVVLLGIGYPEIIHRIWHRLRRTS